jgi:hypothetical protein
MADPVTDPVAEHDARYGEEGAGPPEWARVRDRWHVPGRLVLAWLSSRLYILSSGVRRDTGEAHQLTAMYFDSR